MRTKLIIMRIKELSTAALNSEIPNEEALVVIQELSMILLKAVENKDW